MPRSCSFSLQSITSIDTGPWPLIWKPMRPGVLRLLPISAATAASSPSSSRTGAA
jgi:hypothetical protein